MSSFAPRPRPAPDDPAQIRPHVASPAVASLFGELSVTEVGTSRWHELREQLVRRNLPLVHFLVRRFTGRGEPFDDLVQVATIGLIKAIDRFDVRRGVEFSTYATPTVVGEVKRHFRDRGWALRVPRKLQEHAITVSQASSELFGSLSRSPTIGELASRTRLSEEEVLEALDSSHAYTTLSLDAELDDGAGHFTADDAREEMERVEDRAWLRPLLRRLSKREQQILLLRFFGNMTQSEIAEYVGISQMHVSRLLSRILTRLRDGLSDGRGLAVTG